MNNNKAWILSIVLGLVGIAISAAIFFGMMVVTGMIFGLVAIFTGALAGGLAGLGYRIGGGQLQTKSQASNFLWLTTIIGLISVVAGFTLAPYIYTGAYAMTDFISFVELYAKLGGFSIIDVLFVAIGAYGGRWAGQKLGYAFAMGQSRDEAMKEIKEKGVAKTDEKFK